MIGAENCSELVSDEFWAGLGLDEGGSWLMSRLLLGDFSVDFGYVRLGATSNPKPPKVNPKGTQQ